MILLGTIVAACFLGAPPPNIVWIVVEDMSPHFSCYGETTISTPHVDQLAREGTLFRHAHVTAPVCSASRSALITGCYQTTIGAHHHRSGRGTVKIHLPDGVEPIPALLKRLGYYTCNGSIDSPNHKRLGKTDYNFEWDPAIYDGNDWSGRAPGQPFFAQVQLHGGKYRGQGLDPAWAKRVKKELMQATSPDAVTLPPYYPRDPVLLEDWARYLDAVRMTDKEVGRIIDRLRQENVLDQTVIFFMTDHGISHARGKQFLYDEGTHVPLIVRGPGLTPGQVREDLVEHIDLAATTLRLAGASIPPWMQGKDMFDPAFSRKEVFAARDRCDETVERLRSVRTADYKYIRNGYPLRPMLQPNRYKDSKAILIRLRELHAAGELSPDINQSLFSPTRHEEELYDLRQDPHEMRNLAGDEKYQCVLADMRKKLDDWESRTNDQGSTPESMEMYDSDMAVYLGEVGNRNPPTEIERNIATMKKWAKEGK